MTTLDLCASDRRCRLPWLAAVAVAFSLAACSDDPAPSEDTDVQTDAMDSGDVPSDTDVEDAPTDTDDADDSSSDTVDAGDADAGTPPPSVVWPEPVPYVPATAFVDVADALGRISGWATHITAENRPAVGALGGFATGNGHAFALFGYGNPLNSMHTLAAPTYEKRDGFFGDYALFITANGEVVPFDEEWAARSLDSPAVLTRGRAGDIRIETIDFAPWSDGPERFCVVREIAVINTGADNADGIGIRVRAAGQAAPEAGGLVERRDERVLLTATPSDGIASGRSLDIEVDTLVPGAAARHTVVHCAAFGTEPPTIPDGEADVWFGETAAAYLSWEQHLTDYAFPDRMVEEFVEGMKLTLITQTASTGATSPMSAYTRTWARDNIGPVLAWHAYGGFEEARGTMDYIYGAVVQSGDFANSYAVDLDLSDLPAPPDWDAMPPLSARVSAETPSYMMWIYGEHVAATGETDFVEERWGFLRRAVLAQGFDDDLLLPFTEDETFRAAMNAVFGIAIEYPHAILNSSANSSFLWLGAAHHFVYLAGLVGRDAEAAEVEAFAADVEQATIDTYALDDGCFAAYRERETGELSPPYEDVALKVVWAGWLGGDDPRAAESMACLINTIGQEPGYLRSPVHPSYAGVPALGGGEGLFTGMLPGYGLSALTLIGHPDAEAALAVMGRLASTSGNYQEYMDASTEDGLQLVYDTSGIQGDYSSKYRPWEGGINVAAVLDYLFGAHPDAVEGRLTLRPHLPEGWPEMQATGVRMGDDRFDITVARNDDGVSVTVTSHAEQTVDVTIRWDAETASSVMVDGEPAEDASLVRREHFGITSVETPDLPIEGGGTLTLTFD